MSSNSSSSSSRGGTGDLKEALKRDTSQLEDSHINVNAWNMQMSWVPLAEKYLMREVERQTRGNDTK